MTKDRAIEKAKELAAKHGMDFVVLQTSHPEYGPEDNYTAVDGPTADFDEEIWGYKKIALVDPCGIVDYYA